MLTAAELEIIKPHLSKETVEKLTAENGVALLTEQMKALSTLAIEQAESLKKSETRALSAIEVDPDALETSVELIDTKLSALVTAGAITPAVHKALSLALIGPENNRNVLALSRKATGGAKALAGLIVDALTGNKPVKTGEKTGSQQKLELSRSSEQGDEDFKKVNGIMSAAVNRGSK